MVLAIAYGSGFVILLVYHSTFKIADFGLVQPRILSAGFLFLFFVTLPALAISRTYRLFGLRRSTGTPMAVAVEKEGALKVLLALEFFAVSYGLALICQFLSVKGPVPPHTTLQDLLEIGSVVLLIVLFRVSTKSFHTSPVKTILGTLLSIVSFASFVFETEPRSLFWLTIWLYAVGVAFWALYSARRNPENLRGEEWERYFVFVIAILLPFFVKVYSTVKREYGGGQPVAAVMYFSSTPVFVGQNCANLWVIEETEQGYYAIAQASDRDSFFMPRDQVVAVRFTEKKESQCK